MRTIERTSRFKRDYKREARGQHRTSLDDCLAEVVHALANDAAMERRHHDHALSGNWADFRDCHLRPDLILIYQKPDPNTLRLVRLGSHSELGFG
ncbi:MAG: type II toxin-antitoxin system YafQ family toxin [Gammaproteobacteria bacterium]|nr:type II toxin-antitoxin system YafQ family toxin [Gammaproteobacteria bacterium]MCY4182575.1 type II toxin-antitoxin system YafQ family toxin [Gammaproteobacteria bacterium]MCY4270769.1 type II toxin-antitoxin system YafQ family toxin [Gammaproteobacteria bacterium]MCY4297571.1 type II toxin-antitoxin system YafQ family toxin [Gammaproteobacteria bacterium]